MNNTRRAFVGVTVEEQPDGSAVVVVRTSGKRWRQQDLEIHFAPHVWKDVACAIDRSHYNGRVKSARAMEAKRRLSA